MASPHRGIELWICSNGGGVGGGWMSVGDGSSGSSSVSHRLDSQTAWVGTAGLRQRAERVLNESLENPTFPSWHLRFSPPTQNLHQFAQKEDRVGRTFLPSSDVDAVATAEEEEEEAGGRVPEAEGVEATAVGCCCWKRLFELPPPS